MSDELRVPFSVAIEEKGLLRHRFEELSLPQQVALKIVYGLPLSSDIQDDRGLSELDYWAVSQGHCVYDDLGYVKSVKKADYVPKTYRECWAVWGRRAGKTDTFASTIVAYEAALGGHEAYFRAGKKAICFQIAQDLRMARFALHGIKSTLESMPFIYRNGSKKNRITQVTADRIDLWNGISICVIPPTLKSVRGYDNPISVMDEVGVWYQDSDSANPDVAVYEAVSPGQAQFPNSMIVGISSPWNRGGLLFKRYSSGTEGCSVYCPSCRLEPVDGCENCEKLREPHKNFLILHGTTTINPIITEKWLDSERKKNPRAFERECLARFQDSLSGFLPSALLERARDVGVVGRPPESRNFYIAAIDPAFRQDAFGFTIVHADAKLGIVQDYQKRWEADPIEGKIDPKVIFPLIAAALKQYRCFSVYSDQYTLETLQYLAQQHGFSIEEVTFSSESKAEIYGNLEMLLNQNRIRLLDDDETINELRSLEKRLSEGGKVMIAAPEGLHDDMATVVAIAAHQAIWLLPEPEKAAPKRETDLDKIHKQVARKVALRRTYEGPWF